ncbi:hypothetical protein L6R53_03220 [Myxococcota bacterium]|nr:hypothetical protein [Myxococcota bacterium]
MHSGWRTWPARPGRRAAAAWGGLLALGGCLVAEPHGDGVVPPGSLGPAPRPLWIDDRPTARGGDRSAAPAPSPEAPRRAPTAGSTRLAGTVTWATLPRDQVTVAAYALDGDAPLAWTTLPRAGPFWLDVPVQGGRLVLFAWIDDTGDGPDPTDLSTGPVAVDLDAGPPAPVALVLGEAP